MVKMILCVDLNGSIGKDNDLLFKMKEDMAFFKEQTKNNIVVMGYNTWLSLNEKELPNRKNIVLTNENILNVETSNDIFKTISKYEKEDKDIYIIGGAYVYNECLRLKIVDEILITIVPTVVEGADTKVDLNLMKDFKNKIKMKDFVYKEMRVSIWNWKR